MGKTTKTEIFFSENLSPAEYREYKVFKPISWIICTATCSISLAMICLAIYERYGDSTSRNSVWLPLFWPAYVVALTSLWITAHFSRRHFFLLPRKALRNWKEKHATETGTSPRSPA